MKLRTAATLLFLGWIASFSTRPALAQAASDIPPVPPGMYKEIETLLADAPYALAGQPALEAGALSELIAHLRDDTSPAAAALRRRLAPRLVLLSQQEVMNALATNSEVPAPFQDALEAAWNARSAMPSYFARAIMEPLLALAPRSRHAQELAESFMRYEDDMGITVAEYFAHLRKAQREFLLARKPWTINSDDEIEDSDMLYAVSESIYCPPDPKSGGDEEEEEDAEDTDYPRLWKKSEAEDLIEKLGQRLIDMEFPAESTESGENAAYTVTTWKNLVETLADKAEACKRPEWQRKLKEKEKALLELHALFSEGKAKRLTEEESTDPLDFADRAREELSQRVGAALYADQQAGGQDTWHIIEDIADPVIRFEHTYTKLRDGAASIENIDEILKSAFEAGAAAKSSSTEGYLYFLWSMLGNPGLAKLNRAAHVGKQIAPLLVDSLNHLPKPWRFYFTFSAADGGWSEESWFSRNQVRGQASLYSRAQLSSDGLAEVWKIWESAAPAEARKAFAEIEDSSFKWVLRYEWFKTGLSKAREEITLKEKKAKEAAEGKPKVKKSEEKNP